MDQQILNKSTNQEKEYYYNYETSHHLRPKIQLLQLSTVTSTLITYILFEQWTDFMRTISGTNDFTSSRFMLLYSFIVMLIVSYLQGYLLIINTVHIPNKIYRVISYALLLIGYMFLSIWYYVNYAYIQMNCLVAFCAFNNHETNKEDIGWNVQAGIGIFLLNLLFVIVTIRTIANTYNNTNGIANYVKHNQYFNYTAIVIASVFIAFTTTYLPNEFRYFTNLKMSTDIKTKRGSNVEVTDAVFKTSVFNNGDYWFTLFPDVWIYYGYILSLVLLGMLNRIPSVNKYLARSMVINNDTYSWLQVTFMILTSMMIIFEGIYWYHDHSFGGGRFNTPSDRLQRGSGQLSTILLSLLILTATRDSLFNNALDIAYEKVLQLHRVIAYLFLLFSLTHMFAAWRVYYNNGSFAHDIIHIPTYYPNPPLSPNFNWTIAYMTWVYYIGLIPMFVLSFHLVRRWSYALFYVSHFYYLVLLSAVMVHADAAWTTLLFSFYVYFLNKVFSSGAVGASLHSAKKLGDSYILLKINTPSFKYSHGQYVYLNVPFISLTEWHPFSICSTSPDMVQLCVKVNKYSSGLTFTQQLAILTNDFRTIQVNLDGPYGASTDYSKYNDVLLLAGGVGITPLLSSFKNMIESNKHKNVVLIWVIRELNLLDLVRNLDRDLPAGLSLEVYYTGSEEERSSFMNLKKGRPVINQIINNKDCVSVCGPQRLLEDVRIAMKDSDAFYKEEIFNF